MNANGQIYSKRKYPSPNSQVDLYEITYWSEGLRVKGLLGLPKFAGNFDALLYLRGGLQSIGMVRAARIAQFTMQGFIVFAPYYRGNRGGEGRDEFAGADRFDAVNAVDVLKHFSNKQKVNVYGFSRGGLMALWTAILRNDIASIVTWAGVSDAELTYSDRVDMRRGLKRIIGGSPSKVPELFNARTPLFHAQAIHAPILIIHGENDQHVTIQHAYKLEACLQALGKPVETKYEKNAKHHYEPGTNRAMVRKLCEWMKLQPN